MHTLCKNGNTAPHQTKVAEGKTQENSIFLITLVKEAEPHEAYNIRYVLHVRAKWEKFRSTRKSTMCYKGQQFGDV